jgi:hypothetical protein
VLVDEYQDTNHAQYRLVRVLGEPQRNVMVVGDDDQGIYSWRGADIRNILEFEKDYADAKVVKLEQNYRSTGTILRAANAIVSKNRKRHPKALWTDAGPSPHAVGLPTVIRLGRQSGVPLPSWIHVVAIEADDMVSFVEGLTPAVEAAVPRAVDVIRSVLAHAPAPASAPA